MAPGIQSWVIIRQLAFATLWPGQMENAGPRSRGVENTGSGAKHRVLWKTRGLLENTGSGGKHGVWWKTRGVLTICRNKLVGMTVE